ncbi:alpha/beta fold hydrolase [Thermoflavimicrobium dichotomicum]|uniref:Pimeloyl-[acyl-carrier protein] methyl ester esterase n=1 Tax=Thermoflavimicrobium dichotomicum TaxID=46223 RepID=A0A1I3PYT3_9BACL|nr:alpha/beta fold hydrolase [Thermoflavimicrobium dichotomicum]SFJ26417.1 pimeloyl-[acyl-carrier protein] methyl ester esterase [Thermoflavimicrobium dichotomicum]
MTESITFLWFSGWSVPAAVWQEIIQPFPDFRHALIDFNDCPDVEAIREKGKQAWENITSSSAIIVGWSLGSLVALELAAMDQKKIQAMFLVGSTVQFVRSSVFSHGCDPRQLEWMKRQLVKKPEQVLSAFDGQMFSVSEREAGFLENWSRWRGSEIPAVDALKAGLDYLKQFQMDHLFHDIDVPVFLLTGAEDDICPLKGAQVLAEKLPRAELTVWEQVGHVPFWTRPSAFTDWIKGRLDVVTIKEKDCQTI